MITNVNDSFGQFNITAETQGVDFSTAKVKFTANENSVQTRNEQRDEHLESPNFFDEEKFPKMKFKNTKIEKQSAQENTIHVNLTIKSVRKPVKLTVKNHGV